MTNEHDEWSRESDVIGCSSFLPDVIEGFPSPFGERTLEKTMLRRFENLLRANLMLRRFEDLFRANLAPGEDPMHCSQVPTGKP
jgi:hypothetical protein